ncbi:MAG: hypothetical protein HN391_08965, partial [Anaerolineae bacterium]|nr:hypothetical protein [Anaerolineae bacterium]
MKKILLIILFALLSACAAPPIAIPIQTPSPTLTPTSTPLPPTPDLDNLILSDETLSTADDEIPRYKITDTGWESIPPEELRDELSTLEGWDYARRTDGNLQIIDIDGTPLWTKTGEFWTVLPSDLPIEWSLGDDEKSILNKKGDAIYMLDVEKLAWVEAVKEYPLIPEIDDFRKSYIPEEELFNGDYYIWL